MKNTLKSTTSEAVKEGAFGLPFIILDQRQWPGKGGDVPNETFFGSDRFEVMANSLGM